MNVRRVGIWVAAGFGVFYLISAPENAADVVTGAWGLVRGAAESLSRFVEALV